MAEREAEHAACNSNSVYLGWYHILGILLMLTVGAWPTHALMANGLGYVLILFPPIYYLISGVVSVVAILFTISFLFEKVLSLRLGFLTLALHVGYIPAYLYVFSQQ